MLQILVKCFAVDADEAIRRGDHVVEDVVGAAQSGVQGAVVPMQRGAHCVAASSVIVLYLD